jgi:arylsulfatase A-like enzyme
MSRPPNILLIQADQHRYDCLGSSGHPLLRTPALDRLAAGGIRFARAYCPSPVCVPARNSLIAGAWPSRHGAIANWGTEVPFPVRQILPTYTQALRDGGYRLAHVGKWQVHPERGPETYGFHQHAPAGDYAAWRAARGLPPRPQVGGWFGELDPDAGPEDTRLAWGADQVIRSLETYATQNAPFYVQWDANEPHLPWVLPEPYYSLYSPDEIPPWPSFPDPLTDKPYIQAQQRRTWGLENWTWEQWAPLVGRYLGEISLLDTQVGRVLDALDALGLSQATLVVYTADHGGLCGGHGMIDKHYVMYEDVVHVPLIVRWPGVAAQGGRCQAFVSSALDLAATLCRAAGAPIPESFQGQSLLPLLADPAAEGREDILSVYSGNQFGLYSQRMVRDARWKYVWNAVDVDELYDLEADPGELHNRTADPTCSEDLRRLRHRLVEWMQETGDRLLNQWTKTQLLEGRKI